MTDLSKYQLPQEFWVKASENGTLIKDFLIENELDESAAAVGMIMLSAVMTRNSGHVGKETFIQMASDMWDTAQCVTMN